MLHRLVPLAGAWAALAALMPLIACGQQGPAGEGRNYAAQTYTDMCSGCHGVDLAGGRAQSLFNPAGAGALPDEVLQRFIMNGVPGTEMKPFRGQLSDDQAWQIIAYVRG